MSQKPKHTPCLSRNDWLEIEVDSILCGSFGLLRCTHLLSDCKSAIFFSPLVKPAAEVAFAMAVWPESVIASTLKLIGKALALSRSPESSSYGKLDIVNSPPVSKDCSFSIHLSKRLSSKLCSVTLDSCVLIDWFPMSCRVSCRFYVRLVRR